VDATQCTRPVGIVLNPIGSGIVGSAMAIHSTLGPGLLESAYELCLSHELMKRGLRVRNQLTIPIRYGALSIDNGYRIDLLVNDLVVVALKAIETVLPVHRGQLLSYLRLGGFKLGYLLNFNVAHMRDGIVRMVNGL
jgi:GxxExxY protein